METVMKSTRRLQAYLRSLGIEDDRILAELADRFIEQAATDESGGDVERAALEKIMQQTAVWYRAITTANHAPAELHPLAGWHLRHILRHNPEAILYAPEPEQLKWLADSTDSQAVPERRPNQMPAQPLGELPVGLKKEFWHDVLNRLNQARYKLTAHFRRE